MTSLASQRQREMAGAVDRHKAVAAAMYACERFGGVWVVRSLEGDSGLHNVYRRGEVWQSWHVAEVYSTENGAMTNDR